jgi:hypothetical protein
MAINLFISYDLQVSARNYSRVTEAIRDLGRAMKLHYSLWYVSCAFHNG